MVERTIESFDQEHPLALEDLAERRVLGLSFLHPTVPPLDKRPSAVAVTDEAFQAGNAQLIGHGCGGGLARVGDRHHHRVLVYGNRLLAGQLFAQGLAPCTRFGRPACSPRWRSRPTRRNSGRGAGSERTV